MRSALDGTDSVVLKDKLDNPNGVTIINDLVSWHTGQLAVDYIGTT